MAAEGGLSVARLRCRRCGSVSFARAGAVRAPCPDCHGAREIVERLADRRTGQERRTASRLQRVWNYDPRSWFDRRRAG